MPHIRTGTRTIPTPHLVGWWAGFMPHIRTGTIHTLHLLAGGLVSCHIYVQGLGPYLLRTWWAGGLVSCHIYVQGPYILHTCWLVGWFHATYTYRDWGHTYSTPVGWWAGFMPHIRTGTGTIPTPHLLAGGLVSCHIYVQGLGPYLLHTCWLVGWFHATYTYRDWDHTYSTPVGWWAGFMPHIRTGTGTIPTPHLLAGGLVSCHIYVQGLGPYLLHTCWPVGWFHATYTYRDWDHTYSTPVGWWPGFMPHIRTGTIPKRTCWLVGWFHATYTYRDHT